jgi:chorismate-pyruvate lyase
MSRVRADIAALAALLLGQFALATDAAHQVHHWPDTFQSRIAALALLQTLNAELLSHDSATATLERWCEVHHLAEPPRVKADRLTDGSMTPSAAQLRLLDVKSIHEVSYRHVRLRCGDVVLSEADNWYVPARLTAQMNRTLAATDMPFGRAIESLHAQRHTISAQLLWSPLAMGWEMSAAPPDSPASELEVPAQVLQHRAVLSLPNGKPVSLVTETYSGHLLEFLPPLQ